MQKYLNRVASLLNVLLLVMAVLLFTRTGHPNDARNFIWAFLMIGTPAVTLFALNLPRDAGK